MWLYLLHYDEEIHHTQHYCGQTPNPYRRFQAHAEGAGSALTQEFARRGIRFSLGMVAQCSQAKASQFERGLKNSKNLRNYCEVCMAAEGKFPLQWKGTTRYATQLMSLDKIKWKGGTAKPCYITKGVGPSELDRLQSGHGENSVGYLNWSAIEEAIVAHRVRMLYVDNQAAGYLVHTQTRRSQVLTIQQVIVHRDFRGMNYGRALVEHLACENPASPIHCHVRNDLPANLFWESIGFVRLRTKKHKTSGSKLVEYHRPCFLHYSRKEV